jgi:hypothetical protein
MVNQINIADHVGQCYSNDDGQVIQSVILDHITKNEQITLSFKGIDGVTSSFVNIALIELLETMDFEQVKKKIKFADTSRQINGMIRDRFNFEVNRRKKLISV